jgi:hypothetical protein
LHRRVKHVRIPLAVASKERTNKYMRPNTAKLRVRNHCFALKLFIVFAMNILGLGIPGMEVLAADCWTESWFEQPGQDVFCNCSGTWGQVMDGVVPICPPQGKTYTSGFAHCESAGEGSFNTPKSFTFYSYYSCDSSTDWTGVIACVGVAALIAAGLTIITGGAALVAVLAAMGAGVVGYLGCGPCAYTTCSQNMSSTKYNTFSICDLWGTCGGP